MGMDQYFDPWTGYGDKKSLAMARALCWLFVFCAAPVMAYSLGGVTPRATYSSNVKMISLRTGDVVVVRTGDYKGVQGKVLSFDKVKNKVVVEGVNIRTKHVKPRKEGETGRILKKEMPIHASNIAFSEAALPAPTAADSSE